MSNLSDKERPSYIEVSLMSESHGMLTSFTKCDKEKRGNKRPEFKSVERSE